MSKKNRFKKYIVIGQVNTCPKCGKLMERRAHKEKPRKTWFYQKWDYCKDCHHLQHYEEFKSGAWKEAERQESHFNNI